MGRSTTEVEWNSHENQTVKKSRVPHCSRARDTATCGVYNMVSQIQGRDPNKLACKIIYKSFCKLYKKIKKHYKKVELNCFYVNYFRLHCFHYVVFFITV